MKWNDDYKCGSPGEMAELISNGKWVYARHLEFIDRLLLLVCKRQINRLIINMPPRHGKSEFISKYFSTWFLGNFPDKRIILSSYEAAFASSWGRKARDLLLEHDRSLFDIELNPKSQAAGSFEIAGHGGGMSCAGAGGPITGKGADLLIIDDPVKNSLEAGSLHMRNRIWEWFLSTAYTRLEPDGIIVIIMTRWHQDDLCGRILDSPDTKIVVPKIVGEEIILEKDPGHTNEDENEEDLEDWCCLCLPAIAGDNDPIGRQAGEALWQQRYPAKKLTKIKRVIGSYLFSALYNQAPSPAEGGIFKRKYFRYYLQDDTFYYLMGDTRITYRKCDCIVFAAMDLAVTSKETSDYTVVAVFAVTPKNEILVMEIIRERFDGADHLNLIRDVITRFNPVSIGIESTQYQKSLIQSAIRQGFCVKSLNADKNKVSRALPIAARLEAGCVYFRANAPWLDAFEDELLDFPNGRYDDQADAFAYIASIAWEVSGSRPAGASPIQISLTQGFI